MRTTLIAWGLAVLLAGCGGSDGGTDEEDTAVGADETGGGEVEDDGSSDPLAEAEPEEDEEEDDGMSCLPVSHCHSFANQSCVLVDESGAIQGEDASSGDVRQACPGERGIAESVTDCFDYIEVSDGCGRRRPDLVAPQWPCGRTETTRCDVVMM